MRSVTVHEIRSSKVKPKERYQGTHYWESQACREEGRNTRLREERRGWVKNPKNAAYNYVYHRTSVGVGDIARWAVSSGKGIPATAPETQVSKTDSLARRIRLVEKVDTPRQMSTAFWLCVLLGWLRVHRCYLRK